MAQMRKRNAKSVCVNKASKFLEGILKLLISKYLPGCPTRSVELIPELTGFFMGMW